MRTSCLAAPAPGKQGLYNSVAKKSGVALQEPVGRLNFHHFKIFFRRTAFRAHPIVRNIGPAGTGRKTLFWQTSRFTVDKTTHHTQVFLVITHPDNPIR